MYIHRISQEMSGRVTRKFMKMLAREQSLPPTDTPERKATFERVKKLIKRLDI